LCKQNKGRERKMSAITKTQTRIYDARRILSLLSCPLSYKYIWMLRGSVVLKIRQTYLRFMY